MDFRGLTNRSDPIPITNAVVYARRLSLKYPRDSLLLILNYSFCTWNLGTSTPGCHVSGGGVFSPKNLGFALNVDFRLLFLGERKFRK